MSYYVSSIDCLHLDCKDLMEKDSGIYIMQPDN